MSTSGLIGCRRDGSRPGGAQRWPGMLATDRSDMSYSDECDCVSNLLRAPSPCLYYQLNRSSGASCQDGRSVPGRGRQCAGQGSPVCRAGVVSVPGRGLHCPGDLGGPALINQPVPEVAEQGDGPRYPLGDV
ncbi:hypothetical protein Bbelb_210360 [Branchiostoma belcheri]|nr:hypothetical protein Bbelb_210360 [Branchiostoma belcheri]